MTAVLPEWLPECMEDASLAIDALWKIYLRDLIDDPPACFSLRRFSVDRRIVESGHEYHFEHLTTSGTAPRTFDPYRASRLHWIKPMIEAYASPDVHAWRVRQNGERRLKIALPDYSYLVVVAEDRASVRLVTAFYPNSASTRRKIARDRDRACEEAARGKR